jgi:MFS family permease
MAKSEPAVHNINMCGVTGGIFVVLTVATALYLEGFVTTAWAEENSVHMGLWQTCSSLGRTPSSDWLIASRVFAGLGLVVIVVCFALAAIYMSINNASKNITLVSLAALSFIAAIFIFVSVGVYGAHLKDGAKLSWSFYVTLVSGVFCVLAGILAIVQMRRSNVRL